MTKHALVKAKYLTFAVLPRDIVGLSAVSSNVLEFRFQMNPAVPNMSCSLEGSSHDQSGTQSYKSDSQTLIALRVLRVILTISSAAVLANSAGCVDRFPQQACCT